MREIGRRQI